MKRLIAILTLMLLATGANAATFDPSFKYRTMETSHFSIHYHQGLESLAGRAAGIAEEIQLKLAALLGWNPEEKTNLVLTDNSDFANGMATVIPWNTIYLQTVPPDIMSTIGEYDDWLRILIVHEYAHILTSDPVRGYSKVLRSIFGKTYPGGDATSILLFLVTAPPNMLMPRWWHEGMATWSETELSSSGRGRSSFYEMIYRTAVAEKNLPTIDLINGEAPYWPTGNLPYIFGSRLVQYMAATYGKETPGRILIQQSGRPPYFINGTVADQLDNRDYPAVYQEMLTALTKEQESSIATLGSAPFTKTARITQGETWDTSPRFSPDGKTLAFNRDDRHSHQQIVIIDRQGHMQASFRRQYGDGALAWSPDGRYLLFAQAELAKSVNIYQDIYRYDINTNRTSRLTCGLRAGEPDISPDGKSLVVTVTGNGSQNLALLDLQTLEGLCAPVPTILTDYREQRVSQPRWSPDGKSIAFTVTDNSGKSSLHLLTPETKKDTMLISAGYTLASPAWNSDGTKLYYTSDETGVFNIYSYSLQNSSTLQETHLLSGAFSPDVTTDGTIALAIYTSRGFTVGIVDKNSQFATRERSPSIRAGRLPPGVINLKPAGLPLAAATEPVSAPYSPLQSLTPRFWLPSMIADGPKDTAIGAMTAGQDILGYHTVLASAWYGTAFDKGYFDATYQYGRFTPSLTMQGYALPLTYSDLLGHGDYTEMGKGFIAAVSLPVLRLESGFSITAGYHLRDQKALSPLNGNKFNGIPVFQGRRDSYFAGLNYSNTLKYPWSVSHEEGRTISGLVNYYSSASGSEINSREYTISWEEYVKLPQHHALMLRLTGGMAEGVQIPQQSFQLGGVTTQLNPFGVRGYESRFLTGNQAAVGTAEYRFPLWYFLRGINTKPLFFDRLHGAFFVDAGEVWDRQKSFRGNQIRVGAGTEVRMDLTVGYWLQITPAIGYAHGFDHDGTDQVYFTIYANL